MKLMAYLPAGVLFLNLLCVDNSPAMTIHDFGRLNDDDEATYVTSLVEGSAKALRAQGHPDQAQKTIDLFKDSSKNGGVHQFALNVKDVNDKNRMNAINPNNRADVLMVEDAMEITLKDNGINVPINLLRQISNSFRPSGIPRERPPGT